ncbi:hypothetical protein PtB15_8B242 [Puccinia triticina]|nr:hypothetical protein PtB15_8B242 [Puccinia triticina]
MKWDNSFFLGFVLLIIASTAKATDQFQYPVRKHLDLSTELSLKLNSNDDFIHPKHTDGYIKSREYDFMSLSTQSTSSGRGKALKTNEESKVFSPEDAAGTSARRPESSFLYRSLTNSDAESQMASNLQIRKRPSRPAILQSASQRLWDTNVATTRLDDQPKSQPDGWFLKSAERASTQSRVEPLRPEEISTAQDLLSKVGQHHETSSVPHHSLIPEPEIQAVRKSFNLRNNAPFETIESYQPTSSQFKAMPAIIKPVAQYPRPATGVTPRMNTNPWEVLSRLQPPGHLRMSQSHLISNIQDDILVRFPKSQQLELSNNTPEILTDLERAGINLGNMEEEVESSMYLKTHSQKSTTANVARLNFDMDIFKIDDQIKIPPSIQEDNISHLRNKLKKLLKPVEGDFSEADQLKTAASILRQHHEGASAGVISRRIEMFMYSMDTWYKYWKQAANIDIKNWDRHDFFFGIANVGPVFLVYVEILIAILPTKKSQQLEEILDYQKEMANAMKLLEEFRNYFQDPHSVKNVGEIWKSKRFAAEVFSCKKRQRSAGMLVWHMIELWMEREQKTLWLTFKNKDGYQLTNHLKRFVNNIFFYGIKGLTEQAQNIIRKQSIQTLSQVNKLFS